MPAGERTSSEANETVPPKETPYSAAHLRGHLPLEGEGYRGGGASNPELARTTFRAQGERSDT
jgi:hypothetical protein